MVWPCYLKDGRGREQYAGSISRGKGDPRLAIHPKKEAGKDPEEPGGDEHHGCGSFGDDAHTVHVSKCVFFLKHK